MDTIEKRKLFTVVQSGEKPLAEKKSQLRKFMKSQRILVDNKDVKESLMTEGVLSLLKKTGKWSAERFFVYLSYSSEARTDKLIDCLQEAGKKVYAPRVEGDEMCVVELGEDFTLSSFGIREPVGQPYEGEMDVAIMPLLAVDKKGNRLGYGGGYYDRYLQKHTGVYKIGYAYDIQIVDAVPHETKDITMDAVVTDKRVMYINEEKTCK